jgi:hypothetical protein
MVWHGVAGCSREYAQLFFLKCFFQMLQHDRKTCVLFTDTNLKTYKTLTMKKSILPIALLLTLFSTAFANRPTSVTDRARTSFQKEFLHASEVSWAEKSNYAVATFHIDKEVMFAYYNMQGNLIGLVHNITTASLPESLQNDLKKNYTGYWISDLFQVTTESGDHYFVQLKNADGSVILTTEGSDPWHKYDMPRAISL